jgi:orotidine-5'-phosphate decarboxylase
LPSHLFAGNSVPDAVRTFCTEIVRETSPHALAFKFNLAFFEALGERGLAVMRDVLRAVPEGMLTIADAKRGDIGNSARFYARSFFEDYGFDFVTVAPYMGGDSVTPFLDYPDRGTFLLVRTSNAGGNDFQLLRSDGRPLYRHVAESALKWSHDRPGLLGFVMGATDIEALAALREVCPDTPFLIPGVGAQGGDAEEVVRAAASGPVLVNSSRQILYASSGEDFGPRAAEEACLLRRTLSPNRPVTGGDS